MRITILLLCIGVFSISASVYSQDAKISIQMQDKTVNEVFSAIKAQTTYSFWFDIKDVDLGRHVSLNAKNETVKSVLTQTLKDQDVDFVMYGSHIIIAKKGTLGATEVQQQGITITGTVTDKGEPMPGVNVMEKGTLNGVVTDLNGKYRITVPNRNATLMFSFIGYETQEMFVGDQNAINVALDEATRELEEVVVIGYGTVKKSDLTGAISSVSSKDLGDRVVTGIGSLLNGRVTGVDVSQNAIRIRGVTTLNNTDPLVIVDGFMGGSYHPDDIEHVEILKDASSTAIYGARGANGVILITTKSGREGPLKLNANVFTGFDFWPGKPWDVMNASEVVDYALDARKNSNLTIPDDLNDPKYRTDVTDWQKQMRKTGHRTEANLSFSGGSKNAIYSLFLGYSYADGIAKGSQTDNGMILRSKNEFRLAKWLKSGVNLSMNYSTYRSGWVKVDAIYQSPSFLSVYDPSNVKGLGYADNTNYSQNGIGSDNAMAHAELHDYSGASLGFQPNIWTEISLFNGLTYRVQAGVSGSFNRKSTWHPDYFYGGGVISQNSDLTKNHAYAFSPLIENVLSYSQTFGKHDFSLMVGNSWQNYVENGSLEANGSMFTDYTVKNILFAGSSKVVNQTEGKYAYLSYFGRINYQFNNRYLLTANLRADGSPKFAPANRWGYFPSVAVAWKLHEENWIKNTGIFDQLKLRAGWGKSGNDAIGDFLYLSKVHNINVYFPVGVNGNKATGATVNLNAAGDIRWETTESTTIGLDLSFLRSRLNATVEYFYKNTYDILFTVPRGPSMGYGSTNSYGDPVVNAASVNNRGFELQLGFRNNIGDLQYEVNGNYTYVYNEVTSLGLGQPYIVNVQLSGANYAVSKTEIENPIGYFYGFTADGVFKTQAEVDAANAGAVAKGNQYYQLASTSAGDIRFKDINGDGRVDNEDRTKIGSPIPKHYFGLNLYLAYKGFDFGMNLQGIAGSYIFNNSWGFFTASGQGYGVRDASVVNRWRSEQNPGDGEHARALVGDAPQNNRFSTLLIQKADFLKIRQLSIGYTLPDHVVKKIGLSNIRVYCSTNNLYTFSGYSQGWDPDLAGSSNSNLQRAYDSVTGQLPLPRSVVFGVQFGL